ncbi:hypothetical protein [Arthrobacter pigmenti]
MSQQPHSMEHPGQVVAGSAALASNASGASAPDHAPGQTPERRTPLSVVPASTRRRRVPFAIFCFVSLVAALVGVLVLNVSVSSGQYLLVELNSKQASLTQKNEMLTQQVKNHVAPQNLSSQAAELGMVSSPTFGTIDLNSMSVTGQPEPAEETDGPDARIPAPNVEIVDPAPGTASADTSTDSQGQGSDAGTSSGSEDGEASTAEADRSDDDSIVPAPVQREPAELNGGTIPAPQQAGQE